MAKHGTGSYVRATMEKVRLNDIRKEIDTSTARSSGPGGQHVNKVETKVELRWQVKDSALISDEQRAHLISRLENKLSKSGEIIVTADSKRSQYQNRELAFKKFEKLLAVAFKEKKTRKPTKPTKASKKKRLDAKKKHGEIKQLRKRIL